MNDRLKIIYAEFEREIASKLSNAEQYEFSINDRLKKFQELVTKTIKEKCKTSFDWIQENTIQETKEIGIQFVLKDRSKMEDAQKYFKDLKQCSAKFDFGLSREIENTQREISIINDEFMSCSKTCVSKEESKNDSEIKNCLRNCFDSSLEKNKLIQNNIEGKIDDIILKMNKF